ncbi:MAG: NOB1 family endonuclease [Candidatus Thermoplasmatota archaeon]|nr:NOB1 family endonuclease [Candidatus Thermoplasmatota archaeon]
MNSSKKSKIFILDTSAILSGKPIDLNCVKMVTVPSAFEELKPGGRDYRMLQFLKEKGLLIMSPSKEAVEEINKISRSTGDIDRLSGPDSEILALAFDLKNDYDPIIFTDDYSIQNVASILSIKFENVSQSRITKEFRWIYRCTGCGKKFKENIKVCPICGAQIRKAVSRRKDITK